MAKSEKTAKADKTEKNDGKSEALKLAVAQITKQFGDYEARRDKEDRR